MTNILLFIILFFTILCAVTMGWFLFKHSKRCPRCGKVMKIVSIRLFCNKCGYTE